MDLDTMADAFGRRQGVNYARYLSGFNQALIMAGCTNIARVAMAAAQLGAESGGLQWMEELAPGTAYDITVNRRLALQLGNTEPGDGERFKGRGPLQITGRNNYLRLSTWAHTRGVVPTATYFVDHPTFLAMDQFVWLGFVWYWTVARPALNTLADAHDITGATRAVNGGLNGFDGRKARFEHALTLGNALLPTKPPAIQPTAPTTPTTGDGMFELLYDDPAQGGNAAVYAWNMNGLWHHVPTAAELAWLSKRSLCANASAFAIRGRAGIAVSHAQAHTAHALAIQGRTNKDS